MLSAGTAKKQRMKKTTHEKQEGTLLINDKHGCYTYDPCGQAILYIYRQGHLRL